MNSVRLFLNISAAVLAAAFSASASAAQAVPTESLRESPLVTLSTPGGKFNFPASSFNFNTDAPGLTGAATSHAVAHKEVLIRKRWNSLSPALYEMLDKSSVVEVEVQYVDLSATSTHLFKFKPAHIVSIHHAFDPALQVDVEEITLIYEGLWVEDKVGRNHYQSANWK
jgi:type VI protein secretion system component Hcp